MKRRLALALTAALLTSAAAHAEGTMRLIVPFAAGGAVDVLARLVAPHIGREFGMSVIVDNKPGANGQIGAQALKAAPADGRTFLISTEHPLAVLPFMTPGIGYDPLRDFTMLGKIVDLPWTLSVPASSGSKSVADFVARVRQNPADGNYGVPIAGGVPHLIGEVIARTAGIAMTEVPYNGGAPMIPQLIGGQLGSGVTGVPESAALQKAGKVRIIGISGSRRSPAVPEVATFEEQGYPGLTTVSWVAAFATTGVSANQAERFNKALRTALADPQVQQKVTDMSLAAAPLTLAEAKSEYRALVQYWSESIKVPMQSRSSTK